MRDSKVVVLSDTQCSLGEGLHWDSQRQFVWLVDIVEQRLVWLDLQSGSTGYKRMPEPIGWVFPVADACEVLVGLASGIAICDPFRDDAPIEWVDRSFPQGRHLRLNDAKLDNRGRLWCGSMSTLDSSQSAGSLAHYTPACGDWKIVDTDYSIPNGPAFSPDFTYFLHSDSARRVTFKYELDADGQVTTDRSVWRQFTSLDGMPDGMTFDAEGFVWIAHWGIGQVRRYSPTGDVDSVVSLPTTNVTNVCFGGLNLDRLFVSSARYGLGPQELAREGHAGSVFEILGSSARGVPAGPLSMKVTPEWTRENHVKNTDDVIT